MCPSAGYEAPVRNTHQAPNRSIRPAFCASQLCYRKLPDATPRWGSAAVDVRKLWADAMVITVLAMVS
jgi:hypothetical protein